MPRPPPPFPPGDAGPERGPSGDPPPPPSPPPPLLPRGCGAVMSPPLLDPLLLGSEARAALEAHVRRKGLQLLWGLPALVRRSLGGPPDPEAPLPPCEALRRRGLERHLREKALHRQWGLPEGLRRVLRPPPPEEEGPRDPPAPEKRQQQPPPPRGPKAAQEGEEEGRPPEVPPRKAGAGIPERGTPRGLLREPPPPPRGTPSENGSAGGGGKGPPEAGRGVLLLLRGPDPGGEGPESSLPGEDQRRYFELHLREKALHQRWGPPRRVRESLARAARKQEPPRQ